MAMRKPLTEVCVLQQRSIRYGLFRPTPRARLQRKPPYFPIGRPMVYQWSLYAARIPTALTNILRSNYRSSFCPHSRVVPCPFTVTDTIFGTGFILTTFALY